MQTNRKARKTNNQVLAGVNEKREIMKTLNSRKTKLFAHLIRHNELLKIILKWKVLNKRARGRPSKIYFQENYVPY